MIKKEKPDCYKCKWRGEVKGSAHSCCNHPKVIKNKDSLIKLLMTAQDISKFQMGAGLKIKADEYGIKKGWFIYPYNFDLVWLEECNGFEKKN